MPDRLAVWLGERPAGALVRGPRGMTFHPIPDWPSLTVSPLGAQAPWSRAFSRDWFEGLLPEEAQRTASEHNHGFECGDTFGLLSVIGWECEGAVAVLPEGRRPATTGPYRPLTDAEAWERLDALPNLVDPDDLAVRLSLGGAQEKLLLARTARLGHHRHHQDLARGRHSVVPTPDTR